MEDENKIPDRDYEHMWTKAARIGEELKLQGMKHDDDMRKLYVPTVPKPHGEGVER